MRTSLLIALASTVTVTTMGCGEAGDDSSYGRLRRSPPAVGSADDHDDGDTEGASDTDVGNPHANTVPDAPGTVGTSSSQFSIALASSTPVVDLGEEVDLDVNIQPIDGFTGEVELTVSGLPDGSSAAPIRTTVSGATSAKVKIKAEVDAVTTAANASVPIVVTAKSGDVTATANANFKIAPRLKLTVPVNVDALRAATVQYRDEWGSAFGANQRSLRTQAGNGIVFTVFNADSKPHIIHGASGFAHGNVATPIEPNSFEMANGAPRTRTLNVGANANGYLHDGNQGVGASFRIRIEAAN